MAAARLLCIDDEQRILDLLVEELRDHGFEVRGLTVSAKAIEEILAFRPDLVILDVQMPNMSGFEFMAELKALPGGREIPVIVLTANDNMQDIFGSEGVKGYFVKPVEPLKMEARIRQVLGLTGEIPHPG